MRMRHYFARASGRPRATSAALKAAKLLAAVDEVLREAIEFRGSSVSDYVDTDGRRGSFQNRHRVYGRENQPCRHLRHTDTKDCGGRTRHALLPEVPALRTFLRAALGRPAPAGTLRRTATPGALRTKRSRWTPTAWPIVAARRKRSLSTTRALIALLPTASELWAALFVRSALRVGRRSSLPDR